MANALNKHLRHSFYTIAIPRCHISSHLAAEQATYFHVT
jgi:hypothetical protein